MDSWTVAIVDDDPGQRQLLDNALVRAGYQTRLCSDGNEGLAAAPDVDLMLLDVRMPGPSGLEVLATLRASKPELPVILLTAFIDVRDAVAVMKQGAIDYLEKPVDLDELIAAVDDALGVRKERPTGGHDFRLPPEVIAESEAMRQVFDQAARVAQTDATVLITGESGVGKEVVARFVQKNSPRADRPFVVANCGALSESLMASELFGHVRGAFTGADRDHVGRFEAAHGGTLFLDEVGELPLPLQPVFLRVLEAGTFQRVGDSAERQVDVRLIVATNRDLAADVRAGRFREDLFYRLNVFPLGVPPLRERTEDIVPLTEALLRPQRKRLSPAAARCLCAYDWPGNVRELGNVMARALILSDSRQILASDLPPLIQKNDGPATASGGVLVGTMADIQRQAILEALEKTGGNKTHAAEMLDISRRNLIYKLREYGL